MKKSDLPRKICPVCGLPFVWRKKWSKDWKMSNTAQKDAEEHLNLKIFRYRPNIILTPSF